MRKLITIWKFAIGSFSDDKTEGYDNHVMIFRSILVLVNFVTCFFIIANTLRHW